MIDFSVDSALDEQRKPFQTWLRETLVPQVDQAGGAAPFADDWLVELGKQGYLDPQRPAHEHALWAADLAAVDPARYIAAEVSARWAGNLLARAGRDTADLAAGRQIATVAAVETPDQDTWPATVAEADGDQFRLTGEKQWVTLAPQADLLLVIAAHDGRPGVYVLDAGDGGLSVGKTVTLAGVGGLPVASITLAGALAVRLDADEDLVARLANLQRLSAAALGLGLAEDVFAFARTYAGETKRGGKPLARRQDVHFPIADMRVVADCIRRTLVKAAWHVEHAPREATELCRIVAVYAAEAVPPACGDAIDVQGAAGLTAGNRAERAWRASKLIGHLAEPTVDAIDHLAASALAQFS